LGVGELPPWVKDVSKALRNFQRTHVVILARDRAEGSAVDLASAVASDCLRYGFGLAVESTEATLLILPSRYRMPRRRHCVASEFGHIPGWIRQELDGVDGFSSYLKKCFGEFNANYDLKVANNQLSYDDESTILINLAQRIVRGDRRLFVPLDLLVTLKQWERSGANPGGRDHFFHTFNNLLAGYIILGKLLPTRGGHEVPDRFIKDATGTAKIKPWEILWALTALFHDPGYMAERFWSTVFFGLGIENRGLEDSDVPPKVIQAIRDAWETNFKEPRKNLVSLFNRVSGIWELHNLGEDVREKFDSALERAYFNGKRRGHSVASGLYLIDLCLRDRAKAHINYNPDAANKACVIAALSMMFHDPYCRDTLCSNGITPIPFELLPYASTLVFVDALQDDRRDISRSVFPKNCILERLEIDSLAGIVRARVDLTKVKPKCWPGKIVEYESVMRWVNDASTTRFIIDYRSRLGF
jgi:hypothetical protein